MNLLNRFLILALTVVSSVGATLLTIHYSGWLDRRVEFLVVHPQSVVTAFIEQRGLDLEEDAMAAALRDLDDVVTDEANRIFYGSGQMLINSNHVLAGGTDITDPFIDVVLAEWDLRQ